MSRLNVLIAVGAALVGGAVGAGFAASGTIPAGGPQILPAAFAGGGIVQGSPGRYWTVKPTPPTTSPGGRRHTTGFSWRKAC